MSIYSSLGVRRVINACGIYTDLGGSRMSADVWAAASEANAVWASMDELLAASGERIAGLIGVPAARVVPGASAGLALAVGACVARGDGAIAEALPLHGSVVVVQRCHGAYMYARCASLAGARVEWVDDVERAVGELRPAAILHPAHLDGVGVPLADVSGLGVPVVVDAAFQCFPLEAFGRWGELAVFSAKYFGGPNAGGFVAGSEARVADVAALDFVGYEDGPWRTFGRAFKLDRATVVATVVALEAWVECDHRARLAEYEERARRLASLVGGTLCQFTVDERVSDRGPFNAVRVVGRGVWVGDLAAGDPSVRAVASGEDLVLSVECVTSSEVDEIAAAMATLGPN
jgi:D-glucosaminate-6-phosphate ammonia-lyase